MPVTRSTRRQQHQQPQQELQQQQHTDPDNVTMYLARELRRLREQVQNLQRQNDEQQTLLKSIHQLLLEQREQASSGMRDTPEVPHEHMVQINSSIRTCAEALGEEGFRFLDEPFRSPHNRAVTKLVKEFIIENVKGCQLSDSVLQKKIHTYFHNKRSALKAPLEVRQARRISNRRNRRVLVKLQNRQQQYNLHAEELESEYPQAEALLQKECMSPEISDVEDETTLKVVRPAWRSARANEFLAKLDSYINEAKSAASSSNHKYKEYTRRPIVGPSVLSEELLSSLPPWSK